MAEEGIIICDLDFNQDVFTARKCSTIMNLVESLRDTTDNKEKKRWIGSLWDEFHKQNLFQLPIFYGSRELKAQLLQFVETLEDLPNRSAGSGGSWCLYGTRGVGKSTLLRMMFALCSLLYPEIRVSLHSFEGKCFTANENFQFSDLFMTKGKSSRSHQDMPDNDHLDKAFSDLAIAETLSKCDVVLIDEITVMYDMSEHNEQIRECAKRFVNDLLIFAKKPSAHAIITGSSASIRDMAFNKNGQGGKKWRQMGFPDLNDSVFCPVTLPPIRDLKKFASFLKLVKPKLVDSEKMNEEEVIMNAYRATGGIGRHVMSYHKSQFQIPNQQNLLTEMENCYFRRLMSYFTLKHSLSSSQNPVISVSVSEVFSDEITKAMIVSQYLNSWQDKGLIYRNGTKIELLIPGHIDEIKDIFSEGLNC